MEEKTIDTTIMPPDISKINISEYVFPSSQEGEKNELNAPLIALYPNKGENKNIEAPPSYIANFDRDKITDNFNQGLNSIIAIPEGFFRNANQLDDFDPARQTIIETKKDFELNEELGYFNFPDPPVFSPPLSSSSSSAAATASTPDSDTSSGGNTENNYQEIISGLVKSDSNANTAIRLPTNSVLKGFIGKLKNPEQFKKYQKEQNGDYTWGENQNLVEKNSQPFTTFGDVISPKSTITSYKKFFKQFGLETMDGEDWYSNIANFSEIILNGTDWLIETVDKAFDAASQALESAANSSGYQSAKKIIEDINQYLPKNFKFPSIDFLEKVNQLIFDKDWGVALELQRSKVDENRPSKYYNAETAAIKNLYRSKFSDVIAESLKQGRFWNINPSLELKNYVLQNQAYQDFGIASLDKKGKNYDVVFKDQDNVKYAVKFDDDKYDNSNKNIKRDLGIREQFRNNIPNIKSNMFFQKIVKTGKEPNSI
jgi:hypothetical protein